MSQPEPPIDIFARSQPLVEARDDFPPESRGADMGHVAVEHYVPDVTVEDAPRILRAIEKPAPTHHHWVSAQSISYQFEPVSRVEIVIVEKSDEITGRRRDSGVPRGSGASIDRAANETDPPVVRQRQRIRARIVDDYAFEVGHRLLEDRIERLQS